MIIKVPVSESTGVMDWSATAICRSIVDRIPGRVVAVQDAMAAQLAMQNAAKFGLGTEVEF